MALIKAKQLANEVVKTDGSVAMAANLAMGSNRITGMADPVGTTDAANKQYVDNAINGLKWKQSCLAATTGNITLSGAQTIDGVSVVAGNRVLVKNQTDPTQNGIYDAAAGAWTRSADADTGTELEQAAVFVQQGSTQSDTMWVQTADPVTIGATPITWVQFSSAGSLVAGAGLDLTGNTLSVNQGDGISLTTPTADAVNVNAAAIAGNGLQDDGSNNLRVLAANGSVSVSGSGVQAAVPSTSNKNQTPSVTAGDEQTTGLTIASTPAAGSYVRVSVNGIGYRLGNGVKTLDCYFSADGGTTPRAFSAIVAGDTLYWNGVISGFNLAASDSVDMEYVVA